MGRGRRGGAGSTGRVLPLARRSLPAALLLGLALLVRPSAPPPVDEPPAATWPAPPRFLGTFQLTFYWVAEVLDTDGPAARQVYDRSCKQTAKVSRQFWRRLLMEGTGRLADGRILNYAGACGCRRSPCFSEVGPEAPWGLGVRDLPLEPFRSIAVDPRVVSIGSRLYLPELDGLEMPGEAPWGGFVHDGCVVAVDRGGNIRGRQIDFFAGRRDHYRALRGALRGAHVFRDAPHCASAAAAGGPRLSGRSMVALGRGLAAVGRLARAVDDLRETAAAVVRLPRPERERQLVSL